MLKTAIRAKMLNKKKTVLAALEQLAREEEEEQHKRYGLIRPEGKLDIFSYGEYWWRQNFRFVISFSAYLGAFLTAH